MLRNRKQDTEHQPVRHRIVVAIVLMLPLLAVLGSLAPVFVTVQYEEEEVLVPPKRKPYHVVRLAHRLLLATQDYSTRWMPEMVDLEKLFVSPRYRVHHRAQVSQWRTEMPYFPRSRGEMIVLNDVDDYIANTLFRDALQPGVVADATSVWDPILFDVISDTTRPGNTDQFDDFTGQGDDDDEPPPPIVPEPGTGSLLALGLIVLALRARQRQPATS
jgi:hypothetical protein